jgi:hypothetical protein
MGDRNISVGGNVTGSVLVAGDWANVSANLKVALPDPGSVEIEREIAALKAQLVKLAAPDREKLANAMTDVEIELAKPAPDKDEVGRALERAVGYATKAADFTTKSASIATHLAAAVAWLGANWHKILPIAGLTL